MEKEKIKVGMVQVNNSFNRQNYVPLSLGFLHSYAKKNAANFSDFEFLDPIYKRISIDAATEQLSEADIVAFSTYVWNFKISSEIAKGLKKRNPDVTILFGGPHVPEPMIIKAAPEPEHILEESPENIHGRPLISLTKKIDRPRKDYDTYDYQKSNGLEDFLRRNDFIDLAVTGEGEKVFTSFLESYPTRNYEGISALHRLENGNLIQTIPTVRIKDLNDIPSPYLDGYFDSIIRQSDEEWIGLFETNRGCPFRCSFCDWGGVDKNKMADYDLEARVFPEIDWFSENKIRFVFCTDANFGMYTSEKVGFRDLRIAEKMAANKEKHSYPQRFSVQNTKNSTDASYRIQKVLVKSGLDQGVLLAFQSLHPPTLEAIQRANIKLDNFHELQRRFTADGVTTFSDIILGLPLETYDSFTKGVSTLIEQGQHNRIQINNLSLLPNAPMVKNDHIDKYKLEWVKSDMINTHGSLGEWVDNIHEEQQLVVSTSTMPREEWVRARTFADMTGFLHFNKVLQVPNIILNKEYGITYKEIMDTFTENSAERPLIKEVGSLLREHARGMQRGGPEYIHSKQWLNIWWPSYEFALIKLATENKLGEFYKEAYSTFEDLLKSKGHRGFEPILSEAIDVNKALMKMPFVETDLVLNTEYNVLDVYRSGLLSELKPIERGEFSYTVDRSTNKWNSWEDWCKRVIWFENKKGDYIYHYRPNSEIAHQVA